MICEALVRPVWDTLADRQAAFSIGGGAARRFAIDVGPLAASRDNSPASLRALAELIPEHGTLLLLQADEVALAPGVIAVTTAAGVQMIGSQLGRPPKRDDRIARLADADTDAMIELATLTRPGPFAARTASLGEFWGIKEGGQLIAMAGERMKHVGFSEVSGVCTHPDARGRGLGRSLSAFVAARIAARGETPYLHAYATNTGAIELYRSLGFVVLRSMNVATIARG